MEIFLQNFDLHIHTYCSWQCSWFTIYSTHFFHEESLLCTINKSFETSQEIYIETWTAHPIYQKFELIQCPENSVISWLKSFAIKYSSHSSLLKAQLVETPHIHLSLLRKHGNDPAWSCSYLTPLDISCEWLPNSAIKYGDLIILHWSARSWCNCMSVCKQMSGRIW